MAMTAERKYEQLPQRFASAAEAVSEAKKLVFDRGYRHAEVVNSENGSQIVASIGNAEVGQAAFASTLLETRPVFQIKSWMAIIFSLLIYFSTGVIHDPFATGFIVILFIPMIWLLRYFVNRHFTVCAGCDADVDVSKSPVQCPYCGMHYRFWQLQLTTAFILMIVASLLIWLNVSGKSEFGFPLIYTRHEFGDEFYWYSIPYNLLFSTLLLGCAAIKIERFVRRREARR